MRKPLLLLIALSSLFNITLSAQNSNLTYGIKTGANYSSYSPRYPMAGFKEIHYSSKFGFYLGGILNFEINNNFKLQPELNFASQGARYVSENIHLTSEYGPDIVGDFESRITESTIVIPIVSQYFFSEKFYMEGGPQFGYILDRTEKLIVNPAEQFGDTTNEINDIDYDKFDFGLTFGLGLKFSEKIGLNSRYFFGLIERNNYLKSSVLNLGLEYLF
ncbi:porin family protein [Mangrovimonas sp. TPBH4]|uniref:porin family protein n=1 Tax=Mangrovimonas sp. TPBH4 TaxID=1645914 RepID=UPI0006B5725E|nr:porin family protein [Mangrovimonas sp. TPBH4]